MKFSKQVVGNSLKSLEVSEEKANQRVEEFKRQLKALTVKLKEAENRAEYAEKTVKKLQKEVDRLEGRFLGSCPNYFRFRVFLLSDHKLEDCFETTSAKVFTQLFTLVSRNNLFREKKYLTSVQRLTFISQKSIFNKNFRFSYFTIFPNQAPKGPFRQISQKVSF